MGPTNGSYNESQLRVDDTEWLPEHDYDVKVSWWLLREDNLFLRGPIKFSREGRCGL